MPTSWVPSSPDIVADGLDAWITSLRARLTHGELGDLGPMTLSDGTKLPAELAAKLMLNDLNQSHDETRGRRTGDHGDPAVAMV